MSFFRTQRVLLRMGIPLVAISLALMAAVGTANAGTGNPKTIAVTQAGPMSVNASGTWSWPEMVTATKMSYGGFAIDWGDLTSGNAVGSYHIGDGTAATDIVMQTSPAQGSSGSWGPVSHTYAAAGTNKVCVILYDLGEVKPFKATGYHSLLAGGTDRNTDNSVDNGNETPAMCQTIDVTAPVPTAFQSFQGETATPFQSLQGATSQPTTQGTPPSTSTSGDPTSPNQGAPMLPLVLLIGTGLASIAVFKMERVRR